jgi:hypothetical protein
MGCFILAYQDLFVSERVQVSGQFADLALGRNHRCKGTSIDLVVNSLGISVAWPLRYPADF